MKLKVDANGNAVLQDGKPVYVDEAGKEIAFDPPAMASTINRITEESKGFKTRAQTAEAKLEAFEGIEDPAAAKKALETMKNIDEGQLVAAGKVEEIKNAAKKAAEEQVAAAIKANEAKITEKDGTITKLTGQLNSHIIGGSFKGSKVISEKFAVPADLVESRFGQNFKVEDGKLVAYDSTGNKLYSKTRPGELADFEEAIELLVEAYPHREQILKGNGAAGSGARQNAGGEEKGNRNVSLTGTKQERTSAIAQRFPDLPRAS